MKEKLKGQSTLNVGGFLREFEKDAVKQKVDIIALFASFGVKLKRKGKNYQGLCPWHNDKTPSLSVDPVQGLYNCFSCGEGGDAFTLVQKMKGVGFKEALSFLKQWAGNGSGPKGSTFKLLGEGPREAKAAALSETGDPGQEDDIEPQLEGEPLPGNREEAPATPATTSPSPTKGKEAPGRETASLPGLEGANNLDQTEPEPEEKPEEKTNAQKDNLSLAVIAEYYQKSLYASREATAYLEGRGITNKELLSRYYLGFSAGSLTSKLSAAQKEQLKEIGVLTKTGREHFRNCITFPLWNEQDQVSGFYGRSISESAKLKHLYQQGPHKGLFNHKAAKVYDQIILTESIIDALSLIQIGIENVIPCYGTGGFTEEHLKALKDNLVKTVVLAFDNDEAGAKATEKLKTALLKEGFKVKTIMPPTTKDWNEELLNGLNKELVANQIETAQLFEPAREERQLTVSKEGPKYLFTLGSILYRLLGVKELFVANLRVNIRCEYNQEKYIDNVDLYAARSRNSFAASAASLFSLETKRIENDLVTILEHLEVERDKQFTSGQEKPAELTEEEKELGMSFLTSPDMFDQIVADTETLGYVGEDLNKQLLYIAASSRKLEDPISVIMISESAAGKSYLIDTIKKLMPPEEVVSLTSLSDQALNYLPAGGLTHKFMVMGEAVHSEVVDHQVREMLSAHELSRLVTLKDPKTGELTARSVKTEAVVSLAMSSTRYDINQENASRAFVINSDESIIQTRNIHQAQRKKYSQERYFQKKQEVPLIVKRHYCAQRLLAPRVVINPFADYLDFPDNLMRTRRDHERFIDLIAGVCFLRQYQKPVKTGTEPKTEQEFSYIECDLKDYGVAYAIMKQILPATLTNFPKSALELYSEIRELITGKARREKLQATEVGVCQREVREATGHNHMYVKRNMRVLCEYEYLQIDSRAQRGNRRSYKLVQDKDISQIDLSMVPSPQEMEERLKSGSKPENRLTP